MVIMGLLPLILLGLGGVSLPSLPLSMPPLPPDPVIERAAPDECLLHVACAGLATPAAGSANRAEALLAEAEVRRFIGEMATAVEKMLARQDEKVAEAGFGGPRFTPAMRSLAFTLLTKPAAFTIDALVPGGPETDVRGSLVVNCGVDAEQVRAMLAQALADLRQWEGATVEEFELEGGRWSRFTMLPPDAPDFVWGFKDGLFLATVGPEGVKTLLARLADKARPAPAWKTALEQRLPLDRRSMLAHLDVAKGLAIARDVIRDRDFAPGVEASGLGGLLAVQAIAGLTKAEMASAAILDFDGEPTGFFAAGKGGIAAADLRAIPADATMAQLVKLDLSALLETGYTWMDGVRAGASAQPRQMLEQVRAVAGFDVDEHLLKPLGDTFTGFTLPGPGPLGLPRSGLVVTLDDAATFAKTHKALLALVRQAAAQPGMPALKFDERKVGETPIFTVKLATESLEPAWCIHGDRLLVAVSADMLGAMIDRKADAPALADAAAVKPLLGDRVAALGYQQPKAAVKSLVDAYEQLAPFVAPALDDAGAAVPRLPAADVMTRHLLPAVSVVRRDPGGDILAEGRSTLPLGPFGGAGLGASPATVGIAAGLMLPAVASARDAARRVEGMNNLKQLALAMIVHESMENALPAAAICDDAGKPLLSWRVRMLPYLDEQELYEQFNLDEPWDSEHNKPLVEKMPRLFTSPGDAAKPGMTRYLVPTGEETIFTAPDKTMTMARVADGCARTILIVEAEADKAVPWTKPADLAVNLDKPHDGLKNARAKGFVAAFADGHVEMIPGDVAAESLKAMFTRDAGDQVVTDDGRGNR
jgi:hypothetical protein